jgi:hypothetical protein
LFSSGRSTYCPASRRHIESSGRNPSLDGNYPFLEMTKTDQGLCVLVPHLPAALSENERDRVQEMLLADLVLNKKIRDCVLWYYNPMAIHFSRRLPAQIVVYDCMDELSGFRGAPAGLRSAEKALFARADLVFTGGQTLHEAKKRQHKNVYCFPSSDQDFSRLLAATALNQKISLLSLVRALAIRE